MAYKMRMKIAVIVDIEAADSHEAFQRLEHSKLMLRGSLIQAQTMNIEREAARKYLTIVDARTDAMLSESNG